MSVREHLLMKTSLAYKCSFPSCGRRFSVMSNMRRHSRVHAHPAQSATAKAGTVAEDEWQGSDDDDEGVSTNGSVSAAESSVGGSPRMRMVGGAGVRRSSPLARMHPYAHARPDSPSGQDADEGGGNGMGQSAALYRLPLVPHYAAE